MLCREIHSLEVDGGILDGCQVTFAPGLNCVIGARGTGKSTLLKLLRFALDSPPPGAKEREQFTREIGVILGTGRTCLDFTNELGQRRRICRSPGRYPRLYDESGQVIQEGREIGFRVEAFAQGDLERLLIRDKQSAMDFLDGMIEGMDELKQAARENREQRRQLQVRYESCLAEMEEQRNRIERKKLLAAELRTLDFGEPERKQAAIIQERGWAQAMERQWRSRLQAIKSLTTTPCGWEEEGCLNREMQEEMAGLFNENLDQVRQLLGQAVGLCEEGLQKWAEARTRLDARHEEQEEELRAGLREHGFQATEQLQAEKRRLFEELASLQGCEDMGREAMARCQRLREQKSLLVLEGRRAEETISRQRQRMADQLNLGLAANPLLKFQRRSDRSNYIEFLLSRLKGAVKRNLVDRLATMIAPEQLWRLAEGRSYETVADLVHCWQEEAMQIILALNLSGDAGRLTEIELLDELKIFYQPPNGLEPLEACRLSPGLQCSLLLPMVLMGRPQVLIGDQFEDNLDNGCINELVISRLVGIQQQRQLILATHNPNIVVGGAARRVIVMKATGKCCRVEAQGDLTDARVREEIISTLEGGREAFSRRAAYLGVG